MTRRIKTVFPNSAMVAHVWAQRSQPTGRTATRNVSFEGDNFYSYAARIARFVEAKDGQPVVLLSTRKWSTTTSAHQSMVAGATRQYTQFLVPALDVSADDHHANLVDLKKRYDAEIARLKRKAERPAQDWQWHDLDRLHTQLHDYQVCFGVAIVHDDYDDVIAEVHKHWDAKDVRLADPKVAARRERERERRAAAEAEKERLRRAELSVQIGAWKAGVDVRLPWTGEVYLRVKGERLETSQGAQVPLRDAIRIFRAVKAQRGRAWQGSMSVGHFHVTEIMEDGSFRAGCHFIRWDEIERVARAIGEWEAAVDADLELEVA